METPGELYKQQIKTEQEEIGSSSAVSQIQERNKRIVRYVVILIIILLFLGVGGTFALRYFRLFDEAESPVGGGIDSRPQVLSDSADFYFRVNSQSFFSEPAEFLNDITVQGNAVFNQGLSTNNQDIDAGTGIVIASNIPTVYVSTLTAGTGVTLGGTATNPIINATSTSTTITNSSGVTSLAGQTGALSLSAGSGISVDGLTIANTDTGSSQNIFKSILVTGQNAIVASSNSDSLTFVAGANIVLTTDATTKELTINAVGGGGGSSQWTTAGSSIYYALGNVGIGNASPQADLDVTGAVRFGSLSNGILKVNGTGDISAGLVGLTSEVTGVLPVANGGTGANTLADLITLGTMTTGNYVATVTGNSQITVGGSGGETAGVTLSIAADSIGDAQLTFNTGQDLTTTSSPTFNALSLGSLLISGDTITDFVGAGLQMNGTTLETTLGTMIDLTSEVTGILPLANGGTNANLSPVNGGIVYSDATGMAISAAGNSGQILQSTGAGAPTWVDSSSVGVNYWQRNAGALAPLAISDDLLLGGIASASALIKLGGTTNTHSFFNTGGNVGIGTTDPSTGKLTVVQGLSNGGTALDVSSYNYQSTASMVNFNAINGLPGAVVNIMAGGSAVGTLLRFSAPDTIASGRGIQFGTNAATEMFSDFSGTLIDIDPQFRPTTFPGFTNRLESGTYLNVERSSAAPSGTTMGISGNLATISSNCIESSGTCTDSATLLSLTQTFGKASGNVLNIVNSGTGIGLNLSSNSGGQAAVIINKTGNNDIFTASASGTTRFTIANNGTLTASAYGTGVAQFSSTGVLSSSALNLAGGSSFFTGLLPLANGGTNANLTAVNGGIVYSTSTGMAISSAGNSGQILQSNGATAPTWVDASTVGVSYWQKNLGALAPLSLSDDLLLGGAATASALIKFGGTAGSDSFFNTGGNVGIGLTNPIFVLDVNQKIGMNGIQFAYLPDQTDFINTLIIGDGGGSLSSVGFGEGDYNTFLGMGAGFSNTIGDSNTAVGSNTLSSNTSGIHNTAVGIGALLSNETGYYNTALGSQALEQNIDGLGNTAIGHHTLGENLSGYYNTAIGYQAGRYSEDGGANVFIGKGAGRGSVAYTGSGNNTFIGYESGYTISDNQIGNVFLGYQAGYNEAGSDKLYIDNSNTANPLIWGDFANNYVNFNGNVGIGTTTPATFALEIAGSIGPTVDDTYDLGSAARRFRDLYLGPASLHLGTNGNEGTIGYNTSGNYLTFNPSGDGSPEMVFNDAGNLGIGTTTPSSFMLEVAGSIGPDATGTRNFGSASRVWNTIFANNIISGSTGTQGFWQRNSNTLAPTNSSDDLLLGSIATSSALIRFGGTAGANSFLNTGGNVGIGVTNPIFNLHIQGTTDPAAVTVDAIGAVAANFIGRRANGVVGALTGVVANDNLAVFQGRGYTSAGAYSDVNAFIALRANQTWSGSAMGSYIAFQTVANGATTPTEKMRIGNDGHVGIGTTNPLTTLHLNSPDFTIMHVTNPATGLLSDDGLDIGIDNTGKAYLWNYENTDMVLGTSGTERIRITGDGNVGIGTTAPVGILHVAGRKTGKALAIFDETGNQDIMTASGSGTTRFRITNSGETYVAMGNNVNLFFLNDNNGTSAAMGFSYNGGARSAIRFSQTDTEFITGNTYFTGGNVGIGSTTVGSKLQINGNAAIGYSSSTAGPANGLAISGNVGIGNTTATNAKLDVTGNIYTSGTLTSTDANIAGATFFGVGGGSTQCDSGVVAGNAWLCIDILNSGASELRLQSNGNLITLGTQTPSGNPDVAEQIPVDDLSINEGDVLSATNPSALTSGRSFDKARGTKASKAYDQAVIGIVSKDPSLLIGTENAMELSDDERVINGDKRAIAIAGRVEVKVSTINGEIRSGDIVTTSAIGGFAMKATKAGAVIGKALQATDGTQQQVIACPSGIPSSVSCSKIVVLLNVSWYDPDVYITDTGDVSIIANASEPMVDTYAVKKGSETIERKGLFSDLFSGNITTGELNATKIKIGGVDLMDLIHQSSPTGNSGDSSPSTQSGGNDHAVILNSIQDLQSQTASLSAEFATLESLTSSTNSLLTQLLASPMLNGSGSAVLGADIMANSATVSGQLHVLGRATVTDLGVTGNITAGVMSINGLEGSINTIGEPLKLQNLGVAGLDILDGKITVDTSGNMVSTGEVTVKKLNISESDETEKSIGEATIESGEGYVDVQTTALTENSRIFVTAERPTSIGAKRSGTNTFRIEVTNIPSDDLKVNWWIVN